MEDSAASSRAEAAFTGRADMAWLGAATSIATADGPIPAGWLRAGDLVVTRDRRLQPVVAIGTVEISRHRLLENPATWPVRIGPDALGRGAPSEPLTLSPRQRVLLRGPDLELTLGLSEALVEARHLIGWPGVECDMPVARLTAYQVLLHHHELILADGHWTESLFLDAATLAAIHRDAPGALPPRIAPHRLAALRELREWEAALIAAPAPAAVLRASA